MKSFMTNQVQFQIMQEDDGSFYGLQYTLRKEMPLIENPNDNACKFSLHLSDYMKFIINLCKDKTEPIYCT